MDRLHTAPAVATLEAGYDALLEKPMTTTLADCVRLVRTADRMGQLLQIATPLPPGERPAGAALRRPRRLSRRRCLSSVCTPPLPGLIPRYHVVRQSPDLRERLGTSVILAFHRPVKRIHRLIPPVDRALDCREWPISAISEDPARESLESHLVAFAADRARLEGRIVDVAAIRRD